MATGHIQTPIEQAITNSTWAAVRLGANQACSEFKAKTRYKNGWKMSDDSAGATYWTVWGGDATGVALRVPKLASVGSVLFYAQALAVNDTVEVIITK